MNVILVFTFGVSLKDWFESGLLSREIRIYEEILQKEDIQFSFITFGDETDCKFINNPKIKLKIDSILIIFRLSRPKFFKTIISF